MVPPKAPLGLLPRPILDRRATIVATFKLGQEEAQRAGDGWASGTPTQYFLPRQYRTQAASAPDTIVAIPRGPLWFRRVALIKLAYYRPTLVAARDLV